jgi:hypothetical protein
MIGAESRHLATQPRIVFPVNSSVAHIVTALHPAQSAMGKLHEFEIEHQLACAQELEAKQAVSLNQQTIILTLNMPETWSVLFHFFL